MWSSNNYRNSDKFYNNKNTKIYFSPALYLLYLNGINNFSFEIERQGLVQANFYLKNNNYLDIL